MICAFFSSSCDFRFYICTAKFISCLFANAKRWWAAFCSCFAKDNQFFCRLVEECWAPDMNKRPSFLDILKRLEKIKEALPSEHHWHLFTSWHQTPEIFRWILPSNALLNWYVRRIVHRINWLRSAKTVAVPILYAPIQHSCYACCRFDQDFSTKYQVELCVWEICNKIFTSFAPYYICFFLKCDSEWYWSGNCIFSLYYSFVLW